MIRRPPRSTRTDTLFPYTTLFRSENEDALAQAGWHPFSVDLGFAAGDNTVMITRLTGGGVFPSVTGSKPEQMMPYIADAVRLQTGWEIVFTVGEIGRAHV